MKSLRGYRARWRSLALRLLRLVQGDSITCRVTLTDGSYNDISVTVTGFASNGNPAIKIGIP